MKTRRRNLLFAKAAVSAALVILASACMADAVSAAPGPERRRPSRSEAVSKARGVLDEGQFQKKLPQPEAPALRRDRGIDLPEAGPPVEVAGYIVSTAAWTAIAVVMGLLIWAAVAALTRWGVFSRVLRGGKALPPVAASVVGPVPSEETLSGAQRKASLGLYLDAVRLLFLDSARMVEEAAAVRLEKTLTNGEYLESLQGESRYLLVMSSIASVIDASYYGNRECTKEDWLRCRSAFESLRPALGGGAA